MKQTQLIDYFQKVRHNDTLATIEGVQALKHAARFQAKFEKIVTCDINLLTNLLDELAPDVKDVILTDVEEFSETVFAKLSPQPPRTKVIAVAKRPSYVFEQIDSNKPIIFLEDPRDLENIGAVIRVAAAADAGAVCITGLSDVWHPAVVRGAAGLQYALPVLNIELEKMLSCGRVLLSLDPTGKITSDIHSTNCVFIFGTERYGISEQLLKSSDQIIRLPMKEKVSSLNLATSVAATLFRYT